MALLKEHGTQFSLWYTAAKGMTDEVAASIAAGQDLNACDSVIFVYGCMGDRVYIDISPSCICIAHTS